MTRPLISDAAGVALTPLWLGESPKNVGAEFRSEGAESEEVSRLLLEEAEVLEQLSGDDLFSAPKTSWSPSNSDLRYLRHSLDSDHL